MANAAPDSTSAPAASDDHPSAHVCPWWLGYVLVSPLRKWLENPARLMAPFVRPGMVVLEPGCGMGYFSLPMAEMVGPTGRVLCVDLQQKMLDRLVKRARCAGLRERLDVIACKPGDLGVADWHGRVDLAVAIHMLHEVPDQASLLRQLLEALRPGGALLIREPAGHVSRAQFEATIATAVQTGFLPVSPEKSGRVWTAVLRKAG
jgi:ubiquinone/menaquinone biosynthesis C-methylase UbiE